MKDIIKKYCNVVHNTSTVIERAIQLTIKFLTEFQFPSRDGIQTTKIITAMKKEEVKHTKKRTQRALL